MSLSKNNMQCSTVLKRKVVNKIDEIAKLSMRTRSLEIAYMVQEYMLEHNLLKEDDLR